MINSFDAYKGLISIVVPVYNAAAFLKETIACVQAQRYSDWELLLVDDCSKDNSCDVILNAAKLDQRVRLIRQEKNQGTAAARNRGILEARGRFLCFLDADDLWETDKLDQELMFLLEKGASFVFTGYEFADENGIGLGRIDRKSVV